MGAAARVGDPPSKKGEDLIGQERGQLRSVRARLGLLHRRRQVRRPLDVLSGEAQAIRQETAAIANP